MPQNRQQSTFSRLMASRMFLFALVGIAGLVSFNYGRAYYQDYKIRQEIAELHNEVRRLEKKKIESLEILKYVASQDFVEAKARTELNMKKPGEQVLVVKGEVADDVGENMAASAPSEDKKPLKNIVKWWYYFSHKDIHSS